MALNRINENMIDPNFVQKVNEHTEQLAEIVRNYIQIKPSMSVTEIQNAINDAYTNNLYVKAKSGTYNLNGDLIFKVPMMGDSKGNTLFLFVEGYGFTNFEADGSVRYEIEFIKNITFESDKTSYWNTTDAGEAYDATVTNALAKRVYGQRVYIGNKTIGTDNNITPSTDKNNPFGFWNQDYNQWRDSSGLDLNNLYNSTLYTSIDKSDTNIISTAKGVIFENVDFAGFAVNLTLKTAYTSEFKNCNFYRCNIGIDALDGGTLPGSLASVGSKVTTITVYKCIFSDISFCAVNGYSLLESQIRDNVFQPCKIGVILYAGAENAFYENYNEVMFAGIFIMSVDANSNLIHTNFANTTYTTWNVYIRNGSKNKVRDLRFNRKVYVHADAKNNDFSGDCEVTIMDNNYFWTHGNSIDREKPKTSIIKAIGTGAGCTLEVKYTTRLNNQALKMIASGEGIEFNGNEIILSVEPMEYQTLGAQVGYYDIAGTGTHRVLYFSRFDSTATPPNFVSRDVRTSGQVNVFRVTYLDGYYTT